MKNDGHIKLTEQAIIVMQRTCRVEETLCRLPIFSAVNSHWSSANTSNRNDFISAYISYLLNLKAYNFNAFDPRQNLARRVAAVDFDESWTHYSHSGQRYHFMKASNESEYNAYLNGCNFIKERMDKWVIECQQKLLLLK